LFRRIVLHFILSESWKHWHF